MVSNVAAHGVGRDVAESAVPSGGRILAEAVQSFVERAKHLAAANEYSAWRDRLRDLEARRPTASDRGRFSEEMMEWSVELERVLSEYPESANILPIAERIYLDRVAGLGEEILAAIHEADGKRRPVRTRRTKRS